MVLRCCLLVPKLVPLTRPKSAPTALLIPLRLVRVEHPSAAGIVPLPSQSCSALCTPSVAVFHPETALHTVPHAVCRVVRSDWRDTVGKHRNGQGLESKELLDRY